MVFRSMREILIYRTSPHLVSSYIYVNVDLHYLGPIYADWLIPTYLPTYFGLPPGQILGNNGLQWSPAWRVSKPSMFWVSLPTYLPTYTFTYLYIYLPTYPSGEITGLDGLQINSSTQVQSLTAIGKWSAWVGAKREKKSSLFLWWWFIFYTRRRNHRKGRSWHCSGRY